VDQFELLGKELLAQILTVGIGELRADNPVKPFEGRIGLRIGSPDQGLGFKIEPNGGRKSSRLWLDTFRRREHELNADRATTRTAADRQDEFDRSVFHLRRGEGIGWLDSQAWFRPGRRASRWPDQFETR